MNSLYIFNALCNMSCNLIYLISPVIPVAVTLLGRTKPCYFDLSGVVDFETGE